MMNSLKPITREIKMDEIRIDNLKSYQVAMLNKMWQMQSHEEFVEWSHTLPLHLKEEALQLLRILMLEAQEMEWIYSERVRMSFPRQMMFYLSLDLKRSKLC